MATKTLISHFWNEEFLLPFWIKHHLPLFDHAVLIDYDSTDNSVEIIKQLAPHWEIRKSRNRDFDCVAVDLEVMDIEKEFSGWKMALNTTEFLVTQNLDQLITSHEQAHPQSSGMLATGACIVDPPDIRTLEIDPNKPLVLQRTHGYIEKEHIPEHAWQRHRLIHKNLTGQYSHGRHKSLVKAATNPELFVLWFGWSPMKYIVRRKLSIQTRIPEDNVRTGRGVQHNIDEAGLERLYQMHLKRTNNLWNTHPNLKETTEEMVKYYT